MSKTEKSLFIQSLCNHTRDILLSDLDKYPDNWDGWELRQLIENAFHTTFKMPKLRLREFNNTCLINNFLGGKP